MLSCYLASLAKHSPHFAKLSNNPNALLYTLRPFGLNHQGASTLNLLCVPGLACSKREGNSALSAVRASLVGVCSSGSFCRESPDLSNVQQIRVRSRRETIALLGKAWPKVYQAAKELRRFARLFAKLTQDRSIFLATHERSCTSGRFFSCSS